MNAGEGTGGVGGARCDDCVARLSDYLDDEMGAAERLAIERHLAQCQPCRETLAELRAVVCRAQAGATPVAPPRDLWPGVKERLQPRVQRRWTGVAERIAGGRWLAAAALVLLACLAAFSWLGKPDAGRVTSTVSQPPAPVAGPADNPAYEDTVAELHRAARARLTADPQVVTVLDNNLSSLDRAIAEYEDALAAQPADRELKRRLDEARRRKLEVLQQAVGVEGSN